MKTRINAKGYTEVLTGIYRDKEVWKLRYRVLMEQYLGFQIPKGYHVHHIDGDKLNDHVDNLCLATRPGHSELHRYMKGHELALKNGYFARTLIKKYYDDES